MKKYLLILPLFALMISFVFAGVDYSNGYTWNERQGMKVYLCASDVNQDGYISKVDLIIVQKYFKEKVSDHKGNIKVERADIDKTGMVGARDLKFVTQWQGMDVRKICK